MDAKYGDKARGGSLGLSLRLPRRRGSGTGTAVRRTICALLAFALLVYLPLRSIAGGSSSAALGADSAASVNSHQNYFFNCSRCIFFLIVW